MLVCLYNSRWRSRASHSHLDLHKAHQSKENDLWFFRLLPLRTRFCLGIFQQKLIQWTRSRFDGIRQRIWLTCNALRGAHRSGRSGEVVAVVVRRIDLSIKNMTKCEQLWLIIIHTQRITESLNYAIHLWLHMAKSSFMVINESSLTEARAFPISSPELPVTEPLLAVGENGSTY